MVSKDGSLHATAHTLRKLHRKFHYSKVKIAPIYKSALLTAVQWLVPSAPMHSELAVKCPQTAPFPVASCPMPLLNTTCYNALEQFMAMLVDDHTKCSGYLQLSLPRKGNCRLL